MSSKILIFLVKGSKTILKAFVFISFAIDNRIETFEFLTELEDSSFILRGFILIFIKLTNFPSQVIVLLTKSPKFILRTLILVLPFLGYLGYLHLPFLGNLSDFVFIIGFPPLKILNFLDESSIFIFQIAILVDLVSEVLI